MHNACHLSGQSGVGITRLNISFACGPQRPSWSWDMTQLLHTANMQNAKAKIAFCLAAASVECCSSNEPALDWLQLLFAASWTASLLAAASQLQHLTVHCC